jgi:hypothetical protein
MNAEKKSKLVGDENESRSRTGLQHREPPPTEERQQIQNRNNSDLEESKIAQPNKDPKK